MNSFTYGNFSFEWIFEEASLKEHTVTVEKNQPVKLRGALVSLDEQENLIRKRARWIRDKSKAVASIKEGDIVSGSRIKYLGRHYMAVIQLSDQQRGAKVHFNGSKFLIVVDASVDEIQPLIKRGLERFFREKAEDKLFPRIRFWEKQTGLQSTGSRLYKFPARWASCSKDGVMEFHPRCMELAPKVMDYVIVHELVHTIEMNHTKEFWKLVEDHFPQWKDCHERLDWDL